MVNSVIDPNAVYVSPPCREGYTKYTDYLQDVVHFKEFLDRHDWAISAQTRVRGPVKACGLAQTQVDKKKNFVEDSTDSEFDAPLVHPPSSAAPVPKVVSPPLSTSVVDEKEFKRRLDSAGLLTKEHRAALPSVDGVSGSVQVGKKATKARLKKYCSDNLVDDLIEVMCRQEEVLQIVELQMRIKSQALGRKLIRSDLPKEYKLDTKPKPQPGHATYTDYAALWESSESD